MILLYLLLSFIFNGFVASSIYGGVQQHRAVKTNFRYFSTSFHSAPPNRPIAQPRLIISVFPSGLETAGESARLSLSFEATEADGWSPPAEFSGATESLLFVPGDFGGVHTPVLSRLFRFRLTLCPPGLKLSPDRLSEKKRMNNKTQQLQGNRSFETV